jgi:hypothetical protein
MQSRGRRSFFDNFAKMLVMCEIDYLAGLSHFRQQTKCLLRPEIIKSLHDVVRNERHRGTRTHKLVIPSNAQRKIQLEACAFRELACRFRAPASGKSDKRFAVLTGLGGNPRPLAF